LSKNAKIVEKGDLGDYNMVSLDSKFHDSWRKYKINEFLMPQKKRRSASTQSPTHRQEVNSYLCWWRVERRRAGGIGGAEATALIFLNSQKYQKYMEIKFPKIFPGTNLKVCDDQNCVAGQYSLLIVSINMRMA
jgi:hypothetical protein